MGARRAWQPNRWTFSIDEVSNGVSVAVADDQQGETLRRTGYDPDELLAQVKQEAAELTERRRAVARSSSSA